MSEELKPCPFCGGKARISFLQTAFAGWNGFGDKKIKYRVQIICNKCHARGKPITTDWMVNPYPWQSSWNQKYKKYDKNQEETERFRPYVEQAIEAWNRASTEKSSTVERTAKATRNPQAFFYHCECGYALCCEKNDMNYCPSCGSRLIWGDDDE